MTEKLPENMVAWLAEPLPRDVRTSLTRLAQADDVQHVAVMPDVHLAGDVCNGTVLATSELIYPVAVGNDVGCGMLAVACNLPARVLADEVTAGRILNGMSSRVPVNKHAPETRPERLPMSLQAKLSCPSLDKERTRDGLYQLGTLGRGNHFLELQADAEGRVWLMLHSGSRGMGQAISSFHQRSARSISDLRRCHRAA